MTSLKRKDGRQITDREEVEEICKKFYTDLFWSLVHAPTPQIHAVTQQALPVLISEVRNAAPNEGL